MQGQQPKGTPAMEARRRERALRDDLGRRGSLVGALAGSVGGHVELGLGAAGVVTGELRALDGASCEVHAATAVVWVQVAAIERLAVPEPVPAAAEPTGGSWRHLVQRLDGEAHVKCTLRSGHVVVGLLTASESLVTIHDDRGVQNYVAPEDLVSVSMRS